MPNSQPPFSFVYDRQGSGALLKVWPKKTETRQLDSGRTEHIVPGPIRKPACRSA